MNPVPTPEELLGLAVKVARQAAALVAERRAAGVSVAATKSSEIDIVTQADRDTEELIRSLVLAERPEDGFLGEEGDDLIGTSAVRWVVDPIDGTVNFLYGLGEYAVSIAAQIDGEVVAGVVADVPRGLLYTAYVGAGGDIVSRRDGVPLAVRAPAPLAHRLIATGFSYRADLRALHGAAVARLLPRIRDIRRNGSAALELCHVAEGGLDGYVEEGVHLWDYAAGALVARGAGANVAVMTGQGGATLVVCGPAHGFSELLGAVVEAGYAAPAAGVSAGE